MEANAATQPRQTTIQRDSMLYFRVGYGFTFGDVGYHAPSFGMLGYRGGFKRIAFDSCAHLSNSTPRFLSTRSGLAKPNVGRRTPYDIYRELDHGPGGSAIAASTDTRRAVRAAVKKKLGQ